MDAKTCLLKLKSAGVLSCATTDEYGSPQVRNISAVLYEPEALYFFTARGKDFCRELLRDGRVQILGYTKDYEMIRLSAKARPAAPEKRRRLIDAIFCEYPALCEVYPGDTRDIGAVFEITSAAIEYFSLAAVPVYRESFAIGDAAVSPKGYRITEDCAACSECLKHCPQNCIESGDPFRIRRENCLHCGSCFEFCPFGAVERLGAQ